MFRHRNYTQSEKHNWKITDPFVCEKSHFLKFEQVSLNFFQFKFSQRVVSFTAEAATIFPKQLPRHFYPISPTTPSNLWLSIGSSPVT